MSSRYHQKLQEVEMKVICCLLEDEIESFDKIGTSKKHKETMRTISNNSRPIFGLKDPEIANLLA